MRNVTQDAVEMIETLRLIEERASKVVKIDDFVALFSQEFRNPISSAMNHLQVLSEGGYGKLTRPQAEAVLRISTDLEALANLIFVASDLVHGEHTKKRWQPKTISVSALAEDLEAEAQVYSKPGGARFECRILPGIESISTEPVRLKIVLRSILLNSIKTAEPATVTLEIARDKGSAVFTISDPNASLSEEEAAQFLAASPPQSPRLRTTESLFLVERLLELIDGRLTVQRGQARGIIYRVTLANAIQ